MMPAIRMYVRSLAFSTYRLRPFTSFQLRILLIARGEKQKLPKFIDK